ncbi:NAD-dependent epimerase/dehydratase family protein [uncultured Microbulbifer sp.]|uniref:NAD-dependent epimerase/dehydratase family protein n=1 Tax=uncultured Microbulbifer sp. TaxID=348147 RepID=UPI0025E7639F|nr:NAD-dependent epimerase/dehydratase family protein [uncultured Microbulbifer sp.]
MRWVIVGSSGYIGSALCQFLVERGAPVLSISRSAFAPSGCDHLQLSRFAEEGFEGVFQAGDRVVYTAGLSSAGACRKRPTEAGWLNCELPSRLLQAADSAGIESFLYLSSVKARSAPSGVIAGEDCGNPASDVYGRSKWQAERKMLAQNVRCRFNILRPAAVYGSLAASEGDRAVSPAQGTRGKRAHGIRRLLRRWGGLIPWVPATGFRSFISLADLLQVICLIEDSACDRETLIAAEPKFYDSAALITAASGASVRSSSVLSALLLWPFRLFHKRGLAARVLELERSELYSAGRARARLNWRARDRYRDFLRGY